MKIEETPLPGMFVITPVRHGDARGFFSESYSARAFAEIGVPHTFVQDNHSLSQRAGTVRGLHFQAPPNAQGKLVRCGRGTLFDVGVDLRKGSPTYGAWFGVELSFENGKQMFVPPGFAHGFATRVPDTEIIYKCTDYFAPDSEGTVRWDDPDIGIDWGVAPSEAILSTKDASAPLMADLQSPFDYEV